MQAPFFSAFDALAVDRCGGRTSFAAFHIERLMDAIERSVIGQKIEITMDRALGRQILGDRAPLAAGREHIHQAIHDRPHRDGAFPSAPFRWRDRRFDERPLRVCHVARVAQFAAIVARTIFSRPHRRSPRESGRLIESQAIHPFQLVLGPTLRGRAIPGFYRTAAGAEIDLVLERPSRGPIAVAIKAVAVPSVAKGFHIAVADLEPAASFVVYAGADRYPFGSGIEAIGLRESMALLDADEV
jgi:hypothetical protein